MKVKIISNKKIARDALRLTVEAPFLSSKAGQFVMVKVSDSLVPLLRRPMSIAGHEGRELSIIYKTVGEGTKILATKKAGDEIDIDGPYGNWFDPPEGKKIIMVGGGAGIPPLLYFAKQNKNHGLNITAIVGGASKDDIFGLEELNNACRKTIITTNDGSDGIKGFTIDALKDIENVNNCHIISCGPLGMLEAIEAFCESNGVSAEVSTEEKMGCGFGVCLGCMVETVEGKKRVCVSGPVFKTGVIQWS